MSEDMTATIFQLVYSQVSNLTQEIMEKLSTEYPNGAQKLRSLFQVEMLAINDRKCRELNELCAKLAEEVSISEVYFFLSITR